MEVTSPRNMQAAEPNSGLEHTAESGKQQENVGFGATNKTSSSKLNHSQARFYIQGGFSPSEQAKMLTTGMSSVGLHGTNT
jgi:hypothetical protein